MFTWMLINSMVIEYYLLTSQTAYQAKYLLARNIYFMAMSLSRTFILHDLEIYEDIWEQLKPQFMQLKSFKPISGRAKKKEQAIKRNK